MESENDIPSSQQEKSTHYEQLTGETGQKIHYRAERFETAKLFNGTTPQFFIGDEEVSLENLSFSGLAATTTHKHEIGDRLPIRIIHRGLVLHEALTEVRRTENEGNKYLVAVQIVDHPVVIPDLIDRYHKQRLRTQLDSRKLDSQEIVPQEYKAFCADVVYMIRNYRAVIEGYNLTLGTSESDDALTYFEEKINPQWREIEINGAALTLKIMDDPDKLKAYKEYTELTVTPEFLDGPIFHRSYFKPRGFPGDSEIMGYIYDQGRLGDTPFGQICHHIGVVSGTFLDTRMDMMRDKLLDFGNRRVLENPGQPVRIANLGAGAAREVSSLLRDSRFDTPIEFTLIDQDNIALKQAYQETFSRLRGFTNGTSLNCVHVSFKELMMAGKLFKTLQPQDMIYTLGLMDYFKTPMARLFAKSVYEQLAPGGEMVLANMRQCPETVRWLLEFVVDWSLIYRTEEELVSLVSDLGAESFSVDQDLTGQVYLVTARKPA